MATDSLKFIDNRNGNSYDVPITDGTIRATDLRQIRTDEDDFGLLAYDPSYLNTASCRSSVTYIDGAKGILRYRGYPIEQLAEQSSFLEVAYLLLYGELPTQQQLAQWESDIMGEVMVHENIRRFLQGFRYDAHPMGTLVGTVAALSTFYPEANKVADPVSVELQTRRLVAKMPTLAAFAYRHSMGLPIIYPDASLSYTGNFLNMMFRMTELTYEPNPVLEKALNVLFILHADHEQNCSTSTMRVVGSSLADPYAAVAASTSALFGPRHGGANEAVLRMLNEIGDVSNIPAFMDSVRRGERRLMGFGHRVYKNYDPRARIIKKIAYDVFEVTGRNPLLDIAIELETIALNEDYFIERKLYPNVDFYSGVIYQALGLPSSMFTVLFAIPRTTGWLAQWREKLLDPEQRIARPRQIYVGAAERDYVSIAERSESEPVAREQSHGGESGSLSITDNRNGKQYEIPIANNAIRSFDLRQIKVDEDDFGIMSYDPSFYNTASCQSAITYINGEEGVLRYRGYPVQQLVEHSSYLETAYLLLYGELPTSGQLDQWLWDINQHSLVNESTRHFLDGFRYDAHPVSAVIATVSALSTFYPDAREVEDPESVELQTRRLVAKMPTLAAFAYRHSLGLPYAYPDDNLSFTGDLLNMMFKMTELEHEPNPVWEKALDKLFILQADHGQATSATTMRMVGSSLADPFVSVAAALASLHGPRHGGAAEEALRVFKEIGDVSNVPRYIERVKRGEELLMGFGHRVYKNYDPRAYAIKQIAHDVFSEAESSPTLDIALELERVALEDDYFVERKLYPNIDFYTGCIYEAIGIPRNMFTVMFAIPRTAGWVAQWRELLADSEQRIARPRQIYDGVMYRDYVPVEERSSVVR